MCKYKKINIHLFKKENPGAYASIIEEYKPVTDRWVAVAMFFANDHPPICEVCKERVAVSVKQAKRCKGCLYSDKQVSYEQFCKLYKLKHTPVHWTGRLRKSDKITLHCEKHGNFSQTIKSALAGCRCQQCYGDSKTGQTRYTKNEWIAAFNDVHGEEFGYQMLPDLIYADAKIPIICKVHGEFMQAANVHRAGHGCKACADTKAGQVLDTAAFIAIAQATHGNVYDYSRVVYKGAHIRIKIICKIHGEFLQRPNDHTSGKCGCPECAFIQQSDSVYKSAPEYKIKEFIEQQGIQVIHTYRDLGFEIDLYMPDKSVGIEFNGSYWHSELQGKKDSTYHTSKTALCKEQNIQLIHIWEHDWNIAQALVKSRILAKLGVSERIYARKCVVKEINSSDANMFMDENHIQRACPASVRFGLFYKDKIVAAMTFGKPRYSDKYNFELLRYCSTKGFTVTGGASKLFAKFKSEHQSCAIISYSDRMWNTGALYERLGFVYSHSTKPAYHYTKDYLRFENRVAYQKHKLKDKLEIFDPLLTEWQNMQANGYDRIWDCGNDVWTRSNND